LTRAEHDRRRAPQMRGGLRCRTDWPSSSTEGPRLVILAGWLDRIRRHDGALNARCCKRFDGPSILLVRGALLLRELGPCHLHRHFTDEGHLPHGHRGESIPRPPGCAVNPGRRRVPVPAISMRATLDRPSAMRYLT